MDVALLAQGLITGLLVGGLYGLIATGLTLVFGVMRVLNLAHGEFLMLGMYLAWGFVQTTRLDPYFSPLVTIPVLACFGAAMYWVAIRHVLRAPELSRVVLTVGLLLILQNAALLVFSGDVRSVRSELQFSSLPLGERVIVPLPLLIAFGASLIVTEGLYLFLKHTDLGLRLRAVASHPSAAQLVGIDLDRTFLLAFTLSSACVGLAASLLVVLQPFSPASGGRYILTALSIVILGGLGSFPGALLGGILFGVGEALGALYLPGSLGPVIALGIVVLVLLFRPRGLLG